MAPSKEEVRVACDALRSDAKKWAMASDAMAAASTSAQNLMLGRDQFGYAAESRGLVAAGAHRMKRIGG